MRQVPVFMPVLSAWVQRPPGYEHSLDVGHVRRSNAILVLHYCTSSPDHDYDYVCAQITRRMRNESYCHAHPALLA